MKKRIIALGLLWCLSAVMLQAARVDTVLVRSAAMNKDVKVVYVLPDKAIGKQACPVVYLLHGYGGNARSWVQLKPELPQMAMRKESYLYVRTARTVGIGTVRRILPTVMRLLSPRNW